MKNEIYKNYLIICDNIMLLLTCKTAFRHKNDFATLY